MKILQLMTLALLLAAFGTCTNAGNNDVTPSNVPVVVNNDGAWRVSYYFDKDKDETNNFAGSRFTFRDNGVLEASSNGATTSGTWKVIQDDGRQKLVINTGTASKPLADLTDDWVIIEQSASRIRLQDDNTEHLEELHFEAI